MSFGLACCAIEMIQYYAAPQHDFDRFGTVPRPSPRQSDLLPVAGTLSKRQGPVLRRVYDQIPEPRGTLSPWGAARPPGIFNTYSVVQGVDNINPVDPPGLPAAPEALMDGIIVAGKDWKEKYMKENKIRREVPGPHTVHPF